MGILRQPLFLIGFAGSGKTTVGRLLAKRLHVSFHDTDLLISEQTGSSVPELFANRGERVFRQLETKTLKALIRVVRSPAVVALGGGALMRLENRKLVASAGLTAYLQCAQAELYRRLRAVHDRPLLFSHDYSATALRTKITSLLNERLDGYRTADLVISTTRRTPAEVTRELVRKLEQMHAAD